MATTPRAARATSEQSGWLRSRWHRLSPRSKKLVKFSPLAGVLGLILLFGVAYATTDIPKPSDLDTDQTTIVMFSDGTQMLRLQGEQNRTDVELDTVPEHARQAVLAAEDRGYYEHSGISLRGIARAAYQDVFGSGPTQGGSTITQQYARNKFLTQRRTFARKFRESVIAIKLNRTYDKDQVLEWYLNTIYFGRGAYGIEAASLTYFGVHAKALTVEQAALLAALIRAPEGGDPAKNPEVAERRWRSVLTAMSEMRWLESGKLESAKFPKVRPRAGGAQRGGATGSVGYIGDQVYEELRAKGFSSAEIYTGGLRVTTTIRRNAQVAAQQAVESVLTDPARDPNAALVSLEPGTGRVVAIYGGRDFAKRQFNYAIDGRRQPGSAYKPVVLTAALREDIGLRTKFDGRSPQTFSGYPVENYDDEQFGQIDLVDSTAHSVNTVYVPLGLQAGIKDVLATGYDLGVPERVKCNEDASIFLGSCEQRPIDMAAIYATFAAQGTHATPYVVEKVTRGDRTLFEAEADAEEVLEPDVMADATHAMRSVIERGTATRAKIGRPAAGKTGTTSNNLDAWFCGYVPQLATVVWMGYDPEKDANGVLKPKPMNNVHGRRVTGGSFPAEIWQKYMAKALENVPVRDFPPPAFVGDVKAPSVSASPSASPSPSLSLTPTPSISASPSAEPSVVPTISPSESEPEPSPTESEPEPSPSGSGEPQPSTSPANSP